MTKTEFLALKPGSVITDELQVGVVERIVESRDGRVVYFEGSDLPMDWDNAQYSRVLS